jgi:glycosyltransferase involved in cell wall biosynthesis
MATCTVCLIVKNEEPYLLEWIAYYRVLGFDQIIIYENNSTDKSAALLASLARAKKIIHRPWKFGANESPQITAYMDALKQVTTDWILFVDCDEFLVTHQETWRQILDKVHNREDVTAIGVNWRIFGSSHLPDHEDRPVIERFTWAAETDFPMNSHLKSFLRVGTIGPHIDMHLSDTTGKVVTASGEDMLLAARGRSERVDHSMAQVNHYYTKTYPEFCVKMRRGQGGAGENSDKKYWYDDNSFTLHDVNDVEDKSAWKYLEGTRREMEILLRIVKRHRYFGFALS